MELIGELHATFLFDTPQAAKQGWERVEKRCRNLSVYRWSVDDTLEGARAVTVLTEEPERTSFELALRLLGQHGVQVPTPEGVMARLLEKRREIAATGGRRMKRSPQGTILLPGGAQVPFRRPQG